MSTGYWYKAGPINMTMTATSGTLGGTKSYSNSTRIKLYGKGATTVASGTATLTHTATGVGAFSVTLSGAIYESSTNVSGNGTGTLNTIPRATTPTITNTSGTVITSQTIGTAIRINVSGRASTSFSHELSYSFGSASGTIGTISATAENQYYNWTPGTALGAQIPNATSGTCTITCVTKNGTATIGTTTKTITLTAPTSWVPTNTTAVAPSNTVLGSSVYPATVSGVRVTVTCAGSNSSTVAKVEVTFQNKTYSTTTISSGKATITTDACTGSGSETLTTVVTDSRGRTKSATKTITVTAYASPALSLSIFRTSTSSSTAIDETGAYMRIVLTGSVSNVGSNAVSARTLSYTVQGGSAQTLTPTISGKTISYTGNVAVANDKTCTVTATLTDTAGNTTTVTQTLPVGYKTMDFLAGGRGIAFGTSATEEGFKCAMPATFTDTLDVSENATVGGTLGVTGKTTMSTSETTGNATFDGAMNHVNGSTSMNVPDGVFDLWRAVFPTHRHGRRTSGSKTQTVDITKYRSTNGSNGVWAFMFIGASWAAADATSSLYICHGIQGGAHNECRAVYKDFYGPSISISGTTLTITYYNTDGGAFAIIPLFGKDINIDENTVTPYT